MSFLKKYKLQLFSLLPFIITAIFSEGFLHPDEHFVTLEFLQTKISDFTRPEIFHWDFHERIRPWFQSFIYFLLYKITPELSPFYLATFFRLLHSLLGWFSLYSLCKFYQSEKNKQLQSIMWISWTWFVPFLMARTSSESLSMSLFFLGTSFFLRGKKTQNSLISGLLWGASFLVRFQMGIAMAAANFWYLKQKKPTSLFLIHTSAVLIMIALGVLVDYWGYGEWVFTPYNYFYTNVFESRASAFGTAPFWFYLIKPLIKGGILIPIVLLIGTYSYIRKNVNSIWSPTLASFLIIHSLIPHKETRFLSFIFVSLVLLTFIQDHDIILKIKTKKWFPLLLVINFTMMSKASLTPAEGLLKLYKAVEKTETTKFYTPKNIHGEFFKFQMPFYERLERRTTGFNINKLDEIPATSTLLTTNYKDFKILKQTCQLQWINYPEWILEFNYFDWVNRSAVTALWKCTVPAGTVHF